MVVSTMVLAIFASVHRDDEGGGGDGRCGGRHHHVVLRKPIIIRARVELAQSHDDRRYCKRAKVR